VVEVDRFVEPKVDEEARHKSDLLKRRVSEMLAEVNADAAPDRRVGGGAMGGLHPLSVDRVSETISPETGWSPRRTV